MGGLNKRVQGTVEERRKEGEGPARGLACERWWWYEGRKGRQAAALMTTGGGPGMPMFEIAMATVLREYLRETARGFMDFEVRKLNTKGSREELRQGEEKREAIVYPSSLLSSQLLL